MRSQTPLNIALGVFAGNIAYLFLIFMFYIIFGIAPTELFTGDFSGLFDRFINILRAIGGVLAVVDLIVVGWFILSLSDDSW